MPQRGLGTTILSIFDEEQVARLINLSDGRRVSVLIVIGHPDEDPLMPKRKDVE